MLPLASLQISGGFSWGYVIAIRAIVIGAYMTLKTRGVAPSQWQKDVDTNIKELKGTLQKIDEKYAQHVTDDLKTFAEIKETLGRLDTNIEWLVRTSPNPNKPAHRELSDRSDNGEG